MRRLKWILVVFAAFLALTVGLAYFSRPFLTNLALQKAGKLVGAPVSLSHAEINLLAGALVIHNLKVGDFLTVDKIAVRLPLLPLLKREKTTLSIALNRPVLDFQRAKLKTLKSGSGESPFVIGKIAVQNGKLIYNDRSVGKTTTLSDIDVEIHGGGPFSVRASIDGSAPVSVRGDGDLFAQQISFEAKASLKNLPLPPFEPYYDDPKGKFRITRGSVTLNGPIHCKKNRLHAPIHATVHNLELEPRQKMLFGFAADKVLAELKDQKGNLEFDLLISGDIKNPQFRLLTDLHRQIANAIASTLIKEIPKAIEALPPELNPEKLIPKEVQEGIDKLKGIFGQ